MEARERLEPVEPPDLVERLGIKFDTRVRRIDPGAAAGRLLRAASVRRAIRAQEELRAAAGRGGEQRLAVQFALQYRQAVVVRADAALAPVSEATVMAARQAIFFMFIERSLVFGWLN